MNKSYFELMCVEIQDKEKWYKRAHKRIIKFIKSRLMGLISVRNEENQNALAVAVEESEVIKNFEIAYDKLESQLNKIKSVINNGTRINDHKVMMIEDILDRGNEND